MPFTLSHPAAVLPLSRTRLVFSALVAGAMAPDAGYFLTFSSQHAESHTFKALFTFCLPVGFLLLLLFQKLLKRPLLALLPASHQERLYPSAQRFRFGPARRFGLILLSLLIGSMTHLFWDSFTHATGWFVARIPALQVTTHILPFYPAPVYKLLQHSSTVIGLVILALAYWIWYRKAEPAAARLPRLSARLKAGIACAMLGGACIAAILRTVQPLLSPQTIRWNVVQAAIVFVSTLVLEATVFSVIWNLWRERYEAK